MINLENYKAFLLVAITKEGNIVLQHKGELHDVLSLQKYSNATMKAHVNVCEQKEKLSRLENFRKTFGIKND